MGAQDVSDGGTRGAEGNDADDVHVTTRGRAVEDDDDDDSGRAGLTDPRGQSSRHACVLYR